MKYDTAPIIVKQGQRYRLYGGDTWYVQTTGDVVSSLSHSDRALSKQLFAWHKKNKKEKHRDATSNAVAYELRKLRKALEKATRVYWEVAAGHAKPGWRPWHAE
jgi:hypothetical protein